MKDLKKLADSIKSLDDKIVGCMRCGTCQSVCPVFAETLSEADVARGKLALLSNLAAETLSDAGGVRERLDRCLLCGSCQTACPSGVKITDIFFEAREINAKYLGLNPVKKLVFKAILTHPKLFGAAVKFSLPLGRIFLRPDKNAPQTAYSPLLKPAVGNRHIPVPPANTFSQEFGEIDIPAGKSAIKVLFFPGCMGDKLYTSTTKACLKIFDFHGVGVRIPKDLACCGTPALASGDSDSFEKMAAYNLEKIGAEDFDYLVTACASCTETIRDFWGKRAKSQKHKEIAEKISRKTLDISQFLIDILKVDSARHAPLKPSGTAKERITYHDSCHLKKFLGVSEQPRKLLRLNPAVEFVEMAESDRCCGCGGSFTLTHYELSRKIGKRKRDNIIAANVSTVSAGCPACMMQISNMLALNNDPVKVKHVAEIYADSLPDKPRA